MPEVASAGNGGRILEISRADQANVAALKRSTTGALVVASSRPASAGPAKKDRLSSALLVPLAAVSSSGRLTREGSSARMAGRNGVPTTEAVPARTKTSTGRSAQMSRAAPVMRTIRRRSEVTIRSLRSCRSARVAVNGVTTALSSIRMTAQRATSSAPPMP